MTCVTFGYLLSCFIPNYNWDFYIGGVVGYILAILFSYKEEKKIIKKEEKIDIPMESEVDDAPWYK